MHKERCGLVKSHVIKSVNYPGGIDMGIDGNDESAIIVSKNNMRKAAVMCDKLVLCAALDTVKGANIPPSSRHDLLKSIFPGLLIPGYIPIYEVMLIIL